VARPGLPAQLLQLYHLTGSAPPTPLLLRHTPGSSGSTIAIDDSTYKPGPSCRDWRLSRAVFFEGSGHRGVSVVGVALSIHDKIIILLEGRCFGEAMVREQTKQNMSSSFSIYIP